VVNSIENDCQLPIQTLSFAMFFASARDVDLGTRLAVRLSFHTRGLIHENENPDDRLAKRFDMARRGLDGVLGQLPGRREPHNQILRGGMWHRD
jgi:hypothetical protein